MVSNCGTFGGFWFGCKATDRERGWGGMGSGGGAQEEQVGERGVRFPAGVLMLGGSAPEDWGQAEVSGALAW